MAITDLKGTTWTINSTTCAAGYGSFSVDGYADNDTTKQFEALYIGYYWDAAEGESVAVSNYIMTYPLFDLGGNYPHTPVGTVLTFTGGTDATNANLISWLEANGELQKPNPTLTFDLTTLDLPAGTHTISVIGKADGYKASAESAGVSYTVEASTVTIPKGTYVGKDAVEIMLRSHTENIQFSSYYMKADDEIETYNQPYTGMAFNFYGELTYINANENIDFEVALDYGDGLEWEHTGAETVTLETDQEVSEEFATWFNSNFTKQPDTVTIEAGTYVCIDNVDFPTELPNGITQDINFTSNGISYTQMSVGVGLDWQLMYNTTLAYGVTDPTNFVRKWQNTAYKTITISTPQSVSPEFGEWFNSNFTKQALPTARIDVSIASQSRGYIDLTNYVGNRWEGYSSFTTTDGLQVEIADYYGSETVGLRYNGSTGQVKPISDLYGNITNSVYTCTIPMASG